MRTVCLIMIATITLVLSAPAGADPPERFELSLEFDFAEAENQLVGFMNIDRASLCTSEVVAFEIAFREWLDGGQVGPPPPRPEIPGFDPIQIQRPDLRTGAVLSYGRADDLYFELWHLDDIADRGNVGPCLDTDDRASRFAVGTADWSFHATDLNFTGTRALVFNSTVDGDVVDSAGQRYRYRFDPHDNVTCLDHAVSQRACVVLKAKLQPVGN